MTHLLIVVGLGHGLGNLLMLEIFLLSVMLKGELHFSFSSYSYEAFLFPAALCSLGGQLLLLASFFLMTRPKPLRYLQLTGLFLMWLGFLSLTADFLDNVASVLAILSGIPFVIFSGRLLLKQFRSSKAFKEMEAATA